MALCPLCQVVCQPPFHHVLQHVPSILVSRQAHAVSSWMFSNMVSLKIHKYGSLKHKMSLKLTQRVFSTEFFLSQLREIKKYVVGPMGNYLVSISDFVWHNCWGSKPDYFGLPLIFFGDSVVSKLITFMFLHSFWNQGSFRELGNSKCNLWHFKLFIKHNVNYFLSHNV